MHNKQKNKGEKENMESADAFFMVGNFQVFYCKLFDVLTGLKSLFTFKHKGNT